MHQKKIKKAGALLLAFSLLLGSAPLSALDARAAENSNTSVSVRAAEEGNLSLSANATASDYETADFTADKAIDGSTADKSRWASSTVAGKKWLQLEWNETQSMSSFVIQWERHNPTDYAIAVSDTGSDWSTVWSSTTKPTDLRQEIRLSKACTGKYVRLLINSYDAASDGITWNTVSVYEFEVYTGEIPDSRTELEKIAAGLTAPTVKAGDTQISMPSVPDGASVRFCTDYEQVVGEDGSIYTPLQNMTVKGFYELTQGLESVKSSEFSFLIPGEYTDSDTANKKPEVIPSLQEWHGERGDFIVQDNSRIVADKGLEKTAALFAADYKDITGRDITVVPGTASDVKSGDFFLTLDTKDQGLGKEGYRLTIGETAVVEASQITGAYWGTITILQILKQTKTLLAKGIARDYPKYEVRGFMLDVGRKAFELDTLKEIAKNMAWYKMSDFHVHLNDNLIFLEDYNTMQEAYDNAYAAFRLESGIVNETTGKTATSSDVYYTKDEFRSFIQDSREIGINIIPEIDVPAHSLAFTRAFPEHALMQAGGSHKYLVDHLDITKTKTREFAKTIFGDYLFDENPVFDKDTIVHIGTDEFDYNKNAFREFSDEMIEYVQDTGRTVRMWGSLSTMSGTAKVRSEGVQMNIWNAGWARPQQMYDEGYELINTLDGSLYMVPAAGYYGDFLNAQSLYNNWVPNSMAGTVISAADDQMLGGTYAIWNDMIDTRANGISEYDVFDRFFQALPALSAKMWGEGRESFSQFSKTAAKVSTAPNTNPYHGVKSVEDTILDYSFDQEAVTDASGNGFDAKAKKNVAFADGKTGKALKLNGGTSYVETPLDAIGPDSTLSFWVKKEGGSTDKEQILFESASGLGSYAIKANQKVSGKVGFSREGSDYSFAYTLPEEEWVYLTIKTFSESTELYVNGEFHSKASMDNVGTHLPSDARETATLVLPISRIGSTTDSFQGLIDGVTIEKKSLADESYRIVPQNELTPSACSFHAEGPVPNAIDGDSSTFWHTDWANTDLITEDHNHHFELKLKTPPIIDQLSYLPRQNNKNGRIFKYSINVTRPDGTTVTVVENGTWADDAKEKSIRFDPIEAKTVTLILLDASGGHGTIAELNLYKTDFAKRLKAFDKLNEKDYSEASWSIFKKARIAMDTVLNDPASTSADYMKAYDALKKAAAELKTDLSGLISALENAQSIDLSPYTKESAAAFKTALAAAKAVLEDTSSTQEVVNAALKSLNDAKASLRRVIDTSKLSAAIAEAKVLKLDGYTASSAAAFRAALSNAETLLAKPGVSQAEIDAALLALTNARSGLKAEKPPVPAKKVPAKGYIYKHSPLQYKVTKSAAKNGTVTVTKLIKASAKKVTIPSTVKINGYTFKVTGIAPKAFLGNKKLTSVTIGANITSIGSRSFYNCRKLASITFKSTKAPTIGSKAFTGTSAKCKVITPKKMKKKTLNLLKNRVKKAGISNKVIYKK